MFPTGRALEQTFTSPFAWICRSPSAAQVDRLREEHGAGGSEYLDAVGGEAFEDIYGDERTTVDLSGRYEVMDGRVQLNAYVRNLTNEAEREYQSVRNRRVHHALTGRTFELGVTIVP